ncbi:FGGY family carbohydrate kinase [Elusimicrobiota bacterium]
MVLSASIDIGTTLIKTAVLQEKGNLTDIKGIRSPALEGSGLIMETDAKKYLETATAALNNIKISSNANIPLGIASQRSSFLLWNKETSEPVTPLISWQDRRAHNWCINNSKRASVPVEKTGLLLSPHYAGPKLAYLLSKDNHLDTACSRGELLFGNLETYLIWNWSEGKVHHTDLSMAARTLMADPLKAAWSDELLDLFKIPRLILPEISPTYGLNIPAIQNFTISATITDQAASLLSLIGKDSDCISINLGTGGFLNLPTGNDFRLTPGYLCGPILKGPEGTTLYSLEGTINGISTALEDLKHIQIELQQDDPIPDIFCLPETSGMGSPFWKADMPFLLSDENLSDSQKKCAVIEGIIFRIVNILKDICPVRLPEYIYISGGVARESFISRGLASALMHPVSVPLERDTTLLGAANLAAGITYEPPLIAEIIKPSEKGHYLADKFADWKIWADKITKD